jgi:hypothetical protein
MHRHRSSFATWSPLLAGAIALATIAVVSAASRSTGSPATVTATSGPRTSDARDLLPDLDQETPSDIDVHPVIVDGEVSFRLGFRSAVRNIGAGPLVVEGSRRARANPTMQVDQLVERRGAPPRVVPRVGLMQYTVSPDHRHWHYLQFDRYVLQRAELRATGGKVTMVADRKTGFCLGDRYRAARSLPRMPARRVFTGRCGLTRPDLLQMREGISVGYGDAYSGFLEGQDLPLDGIPAGRYVLVHRVNVGEDLAETSYANNAASVALDLRWDEGRPRVRVIARCPDTDRCDRYARGRTDHRG